MCNSKNHSYSCSCGFGGPHHRGRRGPSYANPNTKSPKQLFLERYPEFTSNDRVAACFLNPNATCPVCGERVFYYQNENGSRVFFDDLVPPWPKHPCTDTQRISARSAGAKLGLAFEFRSQTEVAEIMTWQKDHGSNFETEFADKHGTTPWPLAIIKKRIKGERQVFIVANLLKQGDATNAYLSCKTLPKCCKKGFLIALGKRKISYIDPATLAPISIKITRYRGAKPFLDAMSDAESLA